MAAQSRPAVQSRRQVFLAAGVGSALEFYDFIVYGLMAATIFNKIFFPNFSETTGTIFALLGFGAGFIMRPLGGIIFGHLGDKHGRRSVLITTLLMVGLGTFLMGCIPSYQAAGIWAPILLITLRLVQGLGAGAEYGGAVVMLAEFAPPGKRGLYASVAPMGVTVGRLLAAGIFGMVSLMPADQLIAWGWRIPFLLSAVLTLFGLVIRKSLEETPEFDRTKSAGAIAKVPLFQAIRASPRNFAIVVGAHIGPNAISYIVPVFGVAYLTGHLHLAKSTALWMEAWGEIALLACLPFFGALSDRVGRKPVYLGGALFSALFVFVFFMLLNDPTSVLPGVAFVLALGIGYAAMFGTQPAYYAELFGTNARFSGFSTARELGTLLSGAPGPAIASMLLAWNNGAPWGVAGYISALCLVTVVAIGFGPETFRSALHSSRGGDDDVALGAPGLRSTASF